MTIHNYFRVRDRVKELGQQVEDLETRIKAVNNDLYGLEASKKRLAQGWRMPKLIWTGSSCLLLAVFLPDPYEMIVRIVGTLLSLSAMVYAFRMLGDMRKVLDNDLPVASEIPSTEEIPNMEDVIDE